MLGKRGVTRFTLLMMNGTNCIHIVDDEWNKWLLTTFVYEKKKVEYILRCSSSTHAT